MHIKGWAPRQPLSPPTFPIFPSNPPPLRLIFPKEFSTLRLYRTQHKHAPLSPKRTLPRARIASLLRVTYATTNCAHRRRHAHRRLPVHFDLSFVRIVFTSVCCSAEAPAVFTRSHLLYSLHHGRLECQLKRLPVSHRAMASRDKVTSQ